MTADPINESISLELDMINILFDICFLSRDLILNGYHIASGLFKSSQCKTTGKNSRRMAIYAPTRAYPLYSTVGVV